MTGSKDMVLLYSGGVGVRGHGRRLFQELATRLVVSLDAETVAAIPLDATLKADLRSSGVSVLPLPVNFSRLNAEHFRSYGPLAGVMRGFTRLRLGMRANRALVEGLRSRSEADRVVVHFLDYEYLSLERVLRTLERMERVSSVVTIHPSDFRQRSVSAASLYKNLVRFLLRPRLQRVAKIVCHGDWIADRLRSQFDLQEGFVPIYYPSEGSDRRIDRVGAREITGCSQNKKVLLWFGLIRKNKRLDVALKVLQRLPEDFVLLVAGNPSEVDEAQIRQWVDELGVRDRTILHLRYIPEESLPAYFSAADALLATHDEAFSSASGPVADARTYRLPVLVSGAGQIADYVERFEVGLTGSTADLGAFAEDIDAFLRDDSSVQACQRRIDVAARLLSWDAFADRHAAIYEEVLSNR